MILKVFGLVVGRVRGVVSVEIVVELVVGTLGLLEMMLQRVGLTLKMTGSSCKKKTTIIKKQKVENETKSKKKKRKTP